MIIKIENFGPIEKSEIKIKPLTLFIGPNGTGKTWTATLIACLLSPHMWKYYSNAYAKEKLSERYEIIENAIKDLSVNGNAKIDMKNFMEDYGDEYISNVARLLPKYMPKLLGSQTISFENLHIVAELKDEKFLSLLNESSINTKIGENEDGEALLKLFTQKEDPNLYIIARSSKELQEMPIYMIRDIIASIVFIIIHRSFYNAIYFFPAERTGIMQFISAINSSKLNEEEITNKIRVSKNKNERFLSVLLNDLFHTISVACDPQKQKRRLKQAKKNSQIMKYIDLSKILEDEILCGGIETVEKSDESIEILFKLKDDDNVFDIPPVSSGIKDLIPLVLYLRYMAEERDLVVIDEPEMNLHPEAQIKIMEFLAMMVNSGLNVITTTHSPYLVDHISNLTKAHKLKKDGRKKLEDKFKLKNDLCFIDANKVSAYLFDNNTIKNIFKEDELIEWDTFGNVSDYVSNLYFDM
ncbi:MAG: hypothetical protein EAX96_21385 [Candidatus Lokiarchaeota archaeon]|nr:hypothetical protein [Candidatus Lokiarchaeota archaeon]